MWTYDATSLNTTTTDGRLYTVRLLIGDTDTTDQILQDEEIQFALSQTNDNVYYAASWACLSIVAKYSRMVDTQLDGALQAKYSDRVKQYTLLATQIEKQGKKTSGKALGVFAGGISLAEMEVVELNTDRVKPNFTVNQFDNPEG